MFIPAKVVESKMIDLPKNPSNGAEPDIKTLREVGDKCDPRNGNDDCATSMRCQDDDANGHWTCDCEPGFFVPNDDGHCVKALDPFVSKITESQNINSKTPICKDIKKKKYCKNQQKNGNCDKTAVIEKCMKTCDKCPSSDEIEQLKDEMDLLKETIINQNIVIAELTKEVVQNEENTNKLNKTSLDTMDNISNLMSKLDKNHQDVSNSIQQHESVLEDITSDIVEIKATVADNVQDIALNSAKLDLLTKNKIGSQIVVAGGNPYKDDCQVFDMTSNNSCSNISPYPLELQYATGVVLYGSPLICGGYGRKSGESSNAYQSSCYIHHRSSNLWKLHATMTSTRRHLSSAVTDGALWVTGGQTDGNSNLKSTEYIFSDGTVTNGPNLPTGRYGHCMVTLHDDKVMILGGYPSSNYRNVLIFDPKDNSFTTGPSLRSNKIYGGCAQFLSAKHNNRPVVLAAGGNTRRAEILDYTNANAWEEIEALPDTYSSYFGARAVQSVSGTGAYLQYEKNFFELICSSTSCNWSIMEETLTTSVNYAVMMYLPDGYTC